MKYWLFEFLRKKLNQNPTILIIPMKSSKIYHPYLITIRSVTNKTKTIFLKINSIINTEVRIFNNINGNSSYALFFYFMI